MTDALTLRNRWSATAYTDAQKANHMIGLGWRYGYNLAIKPFLLYGLAGDIDSVGGLTLHDRVGGMAGTGNATIRHAILQGLFPIDYQVFLLYGLVGNKYDNISASTLTLRRGVHALTVME